MKKSQPGFSVAVILVIIVAVGLLGTVGWLVYDQQNRQGGPKPQTGSQNQLQTEKQSETIEAKSSTKPTYTPENLFTENEKLELDKKLIQPNIDYVEQYQGKAGYDPIISIKVSKKTDAEYEAQLAYAKYRYLVNIVFKNGTTDFLFGQNDKIDWWLPECFDGMCGLTDGFQNKYPEIVAKLMAQGNEP